MKFRFVPLRNQVFDLFLLVALSRRSILDKARGSANLVEFPPDRAFGHPPVILQVFVFRVEFTGLL